MIPKLVSNTNTKVPTNILNGNSNIDFVKTLDTIQFDICEEVINKLQN
jgi:hypothetical protein